MTSLVPDTWVISFIQQKAINVKLKGSYINIETSLSFCNKFYLFTSIRSFISHKEIHVKKTLDSHFNILGTVCAESLIIGTVLSLIEAHCAKAMV